MLNIILAIGGLQVIAILIGVVRSKVVAVLLGPEGVGVVSIIDQVVQLVAYVSVLSLPASSVRFLSRAHSESGTRFRHMYEVFLKAIVALSGAGALAALCIAVFLPDLLGPALGRYHFVVAVAVLAVPGMVLGGFIPNVLAAAQKVRASAAVAVASNAGLAVGCVAGIFAGGVLGMYVGSVMAQAVVAFCGLIYLRYAMGLPIVCRSASVLSELNAQREIVFVSSIFAIGATASSAALLVMRQAVLGAEGEAAAGMLQSAYVLAFAITLVLNPTNGLFLTPIMNRNIDVSEKIATALEYQSRLMGLLILFSAPIILLPETCLFVLFSERFTPAAEWVYVFVLAQVVLQLAGVYQAVLIGLDRLKAYTAVTFGGHFIVGTVAWFLVPKIGVEGAALALLIGATFTAVSALTWLHIHHNVLSSRRPFGIVVYGVIAIGLCGHAARYFPEWALWAFATRVVVGAFLVLGIGVFSADRLSALGRGALKAFARP